MSLKLMPSRIDYELKKKVNQIHSNIISIDLRLFNEHNCTMTTDLFNYLKLLNRLGSNESFLDLLNKFQLEYKNADSLLVDILEITINPYAYCKKVLELSRIISMCASYESQRDPNISFINKCV